MSELGPDTPKIILGPTEMATDETSYSLPDFLREQQDCEQGDGDQNQKCLELERSCAAVARDDLREGLRAEMKRYLEK